MEKIKLFKASVTTRSITEILIEADKADKLSVLNGHWEEIVKNKYKYPLVQIWFAKEHLEELVKKIARRDGEIMKPFFDALNGYN